MLDIIAEIKAEAEQELLLAKAKLEVAESIERKYLERQSVEDETADFEETVEGEESVSELGDI